ncbi:MAG: pyrroline-5-carboxylate reductase [Lachnospiraceae bacterium]|nr:pyrroline-5-carboxylate reductase [Lachnospiraceae bacterium]
MLGFIGCGNMAQAMLKGILEKGLYQKEDILVSRRSRSALEAIQKEYGVQATTDNGEVAEKADVLILSVKPNQFANVIPEIADRVSEDTLVISIAAGQTISNIEKIFGKKVFDKNLKLVRTMPNTPALVMAGATGMCFNENVTEDEQEKVIRLFESFGVVAVVPESLMDTVIGVSGSSPAYVFMFIEAMADAAVADGMPRAQAYQLAAQSVYGSAKMVLETGKHPGELKDMVCSPGGTTIEAVRILEEKGLRSAIIEGQMACVKKAALMGRDRGNADA